MARGWTFLTVDVAERQFAGNDGYDDRLTRHYSFDATVPNSSAVQPGDLAVIRDRDVILGQGWIERIETWRGEKRRFRCPRCSKTGFKRRKTLRPRFRCTCGEVFDEPVVETLVDLLMYQAVYGSSWEAFHPRPSVALLDGVYVSNARQHAIREVDLAGWLSLSRDLRRSRG